MNRRLLIVVVLQTLVLLGMIGMRQWTLATGVPVVLETRPVDPRSLFSGDYVNLNYAIADLRLTDLGGDRDFSRHDTLYVVLEQKGEFWSAVSVHRDRPRAPVFIKGRVLYVGDQLWDAQQNRLLAVRHLRVKYGVEDYFVQEGSGRELERPKPDEKISIRVAVDRFGNAGIQAVLVNGQPRFTETLF